MLDTAVEKVVAEIERLSPEQQKEVLEHLEKKVNGKRIPDPTITPKIFGGGSAENHLKPPEFPFTPRIVGTYETEDRTKEHEWLRLHSDEYTGQ